VESVDDPHKWSLGELIDHLVDKVLDGDGATPAAVRMARAVLSRRAACEEVEPMREDTRRRMVRASEDAERGIW
jgi:hypothetical protein